MQILIFTQLLQSYDSRGQGIEKCFAVDIAPVFCPINSVVMVIETCFVVKFEDFVLLHVLLCTMQYYVAFDLDDSMLQKSYPKHLVPKSQAQNNQPSKKILHRISTVCL